MSMPRSIRVGSWSRDTPIKALYAGVLGRARSCLIGTDGAEALPRWDTLTSCLVGLEHKLWGSLELVSSRSGSNARAVVVPDSINLRCLFEPFEGQASDP
jgi:hypothetical protein